MPWNFGSLYGRCDYVVVIREQVVALDCFDVCGWAPQFTSRARTRKATMKVGNALAVPSHVSSSAVQAVVNAWDPAWEDRLKGASVVKGSRRGA